MNQRQVFIIGIIILLIWLTLLACAFPYKIIALLRSAHLYTFNDLDFPAL
jgi:hypothetical protein